MSINYRKAIENEIEDIISCSDVPEDYAHAKSVKEWVLKFRPDADWALQLAAFPISLHSDEYNVIIC